MMPKVNRIILVPILLFAVYSALSQDCPKVKISDFPLADIPGEIAQATPKDSAYLYYYGIGVPKDYVRARLLAFQELAKEGDESEPFTGSSILVMLYANGFGVRRDLDLSIRLACANVGFAPAEIEGRVQHLKEMKAGDTAKVFDLCDDITSGYMEGFCASIHSQIVAIARNASIDSVVRTWPPACHTAYDTLRTVASQFFSQRSFAEVDKGGTGRAAFEIQESDDLEDGFRDMILQADKCALPAASIDSFLRADKALNELYSKVMHKKDSDFGPVSGIDKAGIRATQRLWIRYRDAWVAFGLIKCPGIPDHAWKTLLTNERISQLEELFGYGSAALAKLHPILFQPLLL